MKRFLLCLAAAAGLLSLSARTVYDFNVKDADGRVIKHYEPTEKIQVIEADVKQYLAKPAKTKKNK